MDIGIIIILGIVLASVFFSIKRGIEIGRRREQFGDKDNNSII